MNQTDELSRAGRRRLSRLCAGGAGAFALLSLYGWLVGGLGLAQWHASYVPMAPGSAVVVLLLAGGLLCQSTRRGRYAVGALRAAMLAGALGLLVPGLLLVEQWGGMLERLLAGEPLSVNGYPVGRISLLSAGILGLAGVSLMLLSVAPSGEGVVRGRSHLRGSIACIIAAGITCAGGVVLLGYLYGTPLIMGRPIRPVALPTAAAACLLGAGLLVAAGPNVWPARLLSGPSVGARFARGLLPVMLVLIVVGNWLALHLLEAGMNPVLGVTIRAVVATIAVSSVIVIVSRNIGREVEQAEIDLRISEERFRAFYENSPLPFHSLDADGRFVEVNQAFLDTLGYSRQEVIGRHATEILAEEFRHGFPARFAAYKEAGTVVAAEVGFLRKDGSRVHAILHARLRRSPEGRFLKDYCFWSDITEMERARSAMAEAKAAAEEANHAKDRLLSTVSHELRTPLTPVLVMLSLLEEDARLLPAHRKDISMMRSRIELEARLIDGLLDLTRVTRGKVLLKYEQVDVHALVERVIAMAAADVDASHAAISLELRARDFVAWTDATRLQQVLWNIVKNALQYTPETGSVCIRSTDLAEGVLELQVADTGAGIEPELLPRLFREFERGENAQVRRRGGLGLGLAIARSLIERLGGSVAAASEGLGKGATFTVRLPLGHAARAPEPPRAEPEGEPAAGARERTGLRILLVEGDAETAAALLLALQRRGHGVRVAGSVGEAMAAMQRERFDLLLSDVVLPDGSGLEVMRRFAARQSAPGIALSGYAAPADLQRSREAGFTVHLTKPVAVDGLYAGIEQCLRAHRAK